MDKTAWLFSPERTTTDPAELLYQIYPRKVGRPHALRAIRRALRQYGYDHLHAATQTYAARAQSLNPQFIPYPATWFNQERFNDDPATWTASSAPASGLNPRDLQTVLKIKEERAAALKNDYCVPGPLSDDWSCLIKQAEYRQLRQEIKNLKIMLETSVDQRLRLQP